MYYTGSSPRAVAVAQYGPLYQRLERDYHHVRMLGLFVTGTGVTLQIHNHCRNSTTAFSSDFAIIHMIHIRD